MNTKMLASALFFPFHQTNLLKLSAIIASVCHTLPQAIQDEIVESFDGDLHSLVGQVHNAMLDAHLEQKQEIGK